MRAHISSQMLIHILSVYLPFAIHTVGWHTVRAMRSGMKCGKKTRKKQSGEAGKEIEQKTTGALAQVKAFPAKTIPVRRQGS